MPGRLVLARQLAALAAAGVTLRLARILGPARIGFTAIVSRIFAAWTAVAARIPRTVAPNVAIAVATIAVSIATATATATAAAIAIVAGVAMLRPIALRLCRRSGRLGGSARGRIAK